MTRAPSAWPPCRTAARHERRHLRPESRAESALRRPVTAPRGQSGIQHPRNPASGAAAHLGTITATFGPWRWPPPRPVSKLPIRKAAIVVTWVSLPAGLVGAVLIADRCSRSRGLRCVPAAMAGTCAWAGDGRWALWGRGAWSHFAGADGDLTLDGEVITATAGPSQQLSLAGATGRSLPPTPIGASANSAKPPFRPAAPKSASSGRWTPTRGGAVSASSGTATPSC